MSNHAVQHIWRCSKCSCHMANIITAVGRIRLEKKCPKCKSLNIITITNKELTSQCKYYDPNINDCSGDTDENCD